MANSDDPDEILKNTVFIRVWPRSALFAKVKSSFRDLSTSACTIKHARFIVSNQMVEFIIIQRVKKHMLQQESKKELIWLSNEPRREKTCPRDFRPGDDQTTLLSYRD